jgi:hypothetical protein
MTHIPLDEVLHLLYEFGHLNNSKEPTEPTLDTRFRANSHARSKPWTTAFSMQDKARRC